MTTYEHPQLGETMPFADCDKIRIDPEWAWVAREDGHVVGLLLAAPAHGAVHLMMLRIEHTAGDAMARGRWLNGILHCARRECRERGFDGFMAFIDDSPEGKALRRLIRRPIEEWTFSGTLVGGVF